MPEPQQRPRVVKLTVYVLVNAGEMDPVQEFSRGARTVVLHEVVSNLESVDYVERVIWATA